MRITTTCIPREQRRDLRQTLRKYLTEKGEMTAASFRDLIVGRNTLSRYGVFERAGLRSALTYPPLKSARSEKQPAAMLLGGTGVAVRASGGAWLASASRRLWPRVPAAPREPARERSPRFGLSRPSAGWLVRDGGRLCRARRAGALVLASALVASRHSAGVRAPDGEIAARGARAAGPWDTLAGRTVSPSLLFYARRTVEVLGRKGDARLAELASSRGSCHRARRARSDVPAPPCSRPGDRRLRPPGERRDRASCVA